MISGFYIRFSKKSAIFAADPVSFYGHAIALVIQRTFQNTAVIQNNLFRGIIVVIADAKKLFKALFCGNFYSEHHDLQILCTRRRLFRFRHKKPSQLLCLPPWAI